MRAGKGNRPAAGSFPKSSGLGRRRQNRPVCRQHLLKATPGAAGAWVVATKLLEKLFVAMNHSVATLHMRFGGETSLALAARFKSGGGNPGRLAWPCGTSADCVEDRTIVAGTVNSRSLTLDYLRRRRKAYISPSRISRFGRLVGRKVLGGEFDEGLREDLCL